MQSKLPDVNAAIVRYRSKALEALDRNEISTAAICFSAINALLPEEYKVEINTKKYNELIAAKHIITCPSCNQEHPRGDIRPFDILLSVIESVLARQKTMLVWECPSCNETNDLANSKHQTIDFQKPFYTHVVPEPPARNGLGDRIGYNQRFQEWFAIFVGELEQQIGLYRADYQAQQDTADQPGFDEDE